jgi:glycosyltransferase involved in cell wall biosynthesis
VKIGCITSYRIPSRAANSIQVMKVCQALAQLGHDVRLWSPGKVHTPSHELAAWYGLNTSFVIEWLPDLPRLKRYDFAVKAVQRAIQAKVDLVYTWLPQAGFLSLLRGLPLLLELHDRPTGRIGPWLLRRIDAMHGRKRFAVITRALESALRREFMLKLDQNNTVIAPNGVDLDRFSDLPSPSEARAQLNLPERLTAVYSGHFYAGRGMDILLGLARSFPQVQFLWVGGQPEAVEHHRKIIAGQGVVNVVMTGFIENQRLPVYQAAGEILLMPYERVIAGSGGGNSADICSPMKMFEYLACGRAILTSDLLVLREVLNDSNAVFCPPEELSGWCAALQELVDNPSRVAVLSQQARHDAVGYTWLARMQKIMDNFPLAGKP